ncbi:MAG: polysaccharide export protein [Verrucomicrobia bacterium]|nr:polysaccharide export protein [Verrucomicrobiota bacterium]
MNRVFRVAELSARISVFLILLLPLMGCGTPGTRPGRPNEKVGSPDLLRIGDAIYISFSGVIDPPPKVEDRIREDGCITLPFVGDVKADGLTRFELQQKISGLYVPKYYKRLTVNVNPADRFIYVSGEVRREGSISYTREMTVRKAIAAAGGFGDFADKSSVKLTRTNGQIMTVDCNRALKDPELDLTVFPDDQIHVPRRIF